MTNQPPDTKSFNSLLEIAEKGIKPDESAVRLLEAFRRDNGLTQAQMGEILGITQPNYSQFIKNHRSLSLNSRRRAAAIGISCEALLLLE